ncbi:hypothetical protein B0H11DRAFT_1960024 [Mycena galericulata]|nr:hypothetical protein B0H11DRAFT_1960024 [Mycena galericulata]
MVHPLLHPRRLNELPDYLKSAASRALQGTTMARRSALISIYDYIEKNKEDPLAPVAFLPVFYFILEPPCTLPDDVRIDDNTSENVAKAVFFPAEVLKSIDILGKSNLIPRDVLPDLWPRIWKGILFQYRYFQRGRGDCTPVWAHLLSIIRHVAFLPHLLSPEPYVRSTPGIRHFIMELWPRCLVRKKLDDWSDHLGFLLVNIVEPDQESQFHEIVEGVGGTYLDLASAIIKHVDLFTIAVRSGSVSPTMLHVLTFTHKILTSPADHILLSHGLVKSILDLINSLHASRLSPTSSDALMACLMVLERILLNPPGHVWAVDALDSGILTTIGSITLNGEVVEMCRELCLQFLIKYLPACLAYGSVARHAARALEKIDYIDTLKISTIWSRFYDLATPPFRDLNGPGVLRVRAGRAGVRARKRKFKRLHHFLHDAEALDSHLQHPAENLTYMSDANISVAPVRKLTALLRDQEGYPSEAAQWEYHVTRMAQSAGRVRLHVARVGTESTVRYIVLPLRASSAAVTEGLAALGKEASGMLKGEYDSELEARLKLLVDEPLTEFP